MKRSVSIRTTRIGWRALAATTVSLATTAFGQAPQELVRQAQALVAAGEYDRALETMRAVVRSSPRSDGWVAYAGEVAWRAGKFEEGLRFSRRAIQLNSTVGSYHMTAALNAWGNRDLAAARSAFQRALSFGESRLGAGNFSLAKSVLEGLTDHERVVTWRFNPSKGTAADGYVSIAIPSTQLPYQSGSYELKGAGEHKAAKLGDNDVLLVKAKGSEAFELVVHLKLRPYDFRKELAKLSDSVPIPADAQRFLGPSSGVDPQHRDVVALVEGLRARTKHATVQNVARWVQKNIQYRIVFPGSADGVLRQRAGECGGRAMAFVALCRASGVPARQVWGVTQFSRAAGGATQEVLEFLRQQGTDEALLNDPQTLCSHVWAEVFLPGAGWLPVDPGQPETLGLLPANYVRVLHYEVGAEVEASMRTVASNMTAMAGLLVKYRELKPDANKPKRP